MEFRLTRSKWGTILWGVASILLGVILFMNPASAMQAFTLAVGWILTIFGIASLIGAFTNRGVIMSSLDLYNGIIATLFGVSIVAAPGFFVSFIFILLGFYIVVAGFNGLVAANATRVLGVPHSGVAMVAAILEVILGFMVISSPWAAAGTTMILCAVALIYTGVTHIVDGAKMPSAKDE